MLSIVSDGQTTKIVHPKAGDISEGLARLDIIVIPGEPVRAVLTYDYVELGMSFEEPKKDAIAVHPAIAAHRSIANG